MEEKKIVTEFMEAKMAKEHKMFMEKQDRQRSRVNSHMQVAFKDAGVTEMETDSFLIAAAMAKARAGHNPGWSESRHIFFAMEEILMHPFSCTITQVAGTEENTFGYTVANKVAQKDLEKMSYDVRGEWSKRGVEVIYWHVKKDTLRDLAGRLRHIYKDIVSKIE